MSGAHSLCRLTAQQYRGRTVLSDCYCTAPFKVMQPFYEGNQAKVILMTASAGILAGDRQELQFSVEPGADLTVLGQGYTKLFRSEYDPSGQTLSMTVQSGGTLRYLPRPIIPFAGSSFSAHGEVSLARDSRLIWSEILSCGRVAMGEQFQMQRYHSRLVVRVEGTPVFLDHCLLQPERVDYRSVGFFDGYSHMGMLYLYGEDEVALLDAVRSLPFQGRKAASRARAGVVVRALARRGEQIEQLFQRIAGQCAGV